MSTNATVSCADGIQWILKLLGECVETTRDKVSIAFGILSIAAWFAFAFPQMVTNYIKKIPDQAVSPYLLLFWLLGDSLNFVGAFLTVQLFLQIVLAAYTIVVDLILISQFVYYSRLHKRNLRKPQDIFSDTSSSVISSALQSAPKFLATALLGGVALTYFNGIFLLTTTDHLSMTISSDHILGRQLLQIKNDTTSKDPWAAFLPSVKEKIGYAIGCISTLMYVLSRLPQIFRNFKRKSTEGLSVALFVLAVFGNTFYGLQIFVKSVEIVAIVKSLPWIVGSFGVLAFDFIILFQFLIFRQTSITISIEDLDTVDGSTDTVR